MYLNNSYWVRTCDRVKVLCFKEFNEDYRITLIHLAKYKPVMFAMAKLMEMGTTEQNKVALYLFNNISSIAIKGCC